MTDESTAKTRIVPLLPLRDIIVFPHHVVPLYVGRKKSVNALDQAMSQEKDILLSAQKDPTVSEPTADDIFRVGTVGSIIQLLKLKQDTVKVLMEGKKRAIIKRYIPNDDLFLVEEQPNPSIETEALIRSVKNSFEQYVKLDKKILPEVITTVSSIEEAGRLADTIVTYINLKLYDKQKVLETIDPHERLEVLLGLINAEMEILRMEKKIKTRVKQQMEKTQREYYLQEQKSAIEKELGGDDKTDLKELEEQIKAKKMSPEATEKVEKEFKRLKTMSPMMAEATVVRNYIEWVISLPWYDHTDDKLDITEAERILEEDHFGLKDPKQRILEYLAVQSLVKKLRGPILCFVGPPGVGKTSLAKSIARATARHFVRLSLGGVRDEAEIRGHRRTYIGAMPGKIIQMLKKAKSNNPVFLLDEVDKMSVDFRGDPSAALLEVLDPEQNETFLDHYLDIDYDLSDIMFITTANTLPAIPAPLLDRMEIIRIAGYTEIEKLEIARNFIVPKQTEENGLSAENIRISDLALKHVIRRYTREAGVRNLEREVASICRKIAKEVVRERNEKTPSIQHNVGVKQVGSLLGVPRFRYGRAEEKDEIGITCGLAWTESGGELLLTEVTTMPGKGKLLITGKLGEVMQESAQAAMSYVRSRAELLGLDKNFYQNIDIHVHVPEGAIPKDGPSAGITITTSIISALTRIPIRKDLAMTGEITLRGRILPIGGLKEKSIAAHRAGLKQIIVPKENEKDLKEIPAAIKSRVQFITVEHMDEVLRHALATDQAEAFSTRLRNWPPAPAVPPAAPTVAKESTPDAPASPPATPH